MGVISAIEAAALERAGEAPMLATVERWAAINSGSDNLAGLEQMPLRLLSPYESFSEDDFQECHTILHSRYSDWLG